MLPSALFRRLKKIETKFSQALRFDHAAKRSKPLALISQPVELCNSHRLYTKNIGNYISRTDSKALPEDYVPMCNDLLQRFRETYNHLPIRFWSQTGLILMTKRYLITNKSVITSRSFRLQQAHQVWMQRVEDLQPNTQKVSGGFLPPADWDITTRTTEVCNHSFKTEGKVLVIHLGSLYTEKTVGEDALPALEQNRNRNSWIPN